ncbi:unnamed protein product [Vitrella brassicaformis CCMP3155]|uniref:Uncharacterized protein n=1 Tax=Vitrella brassicaformis (strain CCMP3155) TaxID=1169540 RepID=A0A0G4FMU4_VITBC|nr:unnamed protein product [Vitrella brassicaformis CCMP3155]|eukprot:CEM14904.1 unnamed protein product [Vitrella brassicaformis CCMP3155]
MPFVETIFAVGAAFATKTAVTAGGAMAVTAAPGLGLMCFEMATLFVAGVVAILWPEEETIAASELAIVGRSSLSSTQPPRQPHQGGRCAQHGHLPSIRELLESAGVLLPGVDIAVYILYRERTSSTQPRMSPTSSSPSILSRRASRRTRTARRRRSASSWKGDTEDEGGASDGYSPLLPHIHNAPASDARTQEAADTSEEASLAILSTFRPSVRCLVHHSPKYFAILEGHSAAGRVILKCAVPEGLGKLTKGQLQDNNTTLQKEAKAILELTARRSTLASPVVASGTIPADREWLWPKGTRAGSAEKAPGRFPVRMVCRSEKKVVGVRGFFYMSKYISFLPPAAVEQLRPAVEEELRQRVKKPPPAAYTGGRAAVAKLRRELLPDDDDESDEEEEEDDDAPHYRQLAVSVLRSLAEVFACHLVHGDTSPENVLVEWRMRGTGEGGGEGELGPRWIDLELSQPITDTDVSPLDPTRTAVNDVPVPPINPPHNDPAANLRSVECLRRAAKRELAAATTTSPGEPIPTSSGSSSDSSNGSSSDSSGPMTAHATARCRSSAMRVAFKKRFEAPLEKETNLVRKLFDLPAESTKVVLDHAGGDKPIDDAIAVMMKAVDESRVTEALRILMHLAANISKHPDESRTVVKAQKRHARLLQSVDRALLDVHELMDQVGGH